MPLRVARISSRMKVSESKTRHCLHQLRVNGVMFGNKDILGMTPSAFIEKVQLSGNSVYITLPRFIGTSIAADLSPLKFYTKEAAEERKGRRCQKWLWQHFKAQTNTQSGKREAKTQMSYYNFAKESATYGLACDSSVSRL